MNSRPNSVLLENPPGLQEPVIKNKADNANADPSIDSRVLDYTNTILSTPKDIFNQLALTIKQALTFKRVQVAFPHFAEYALIASSFKQSINLVLNPSKIVSIWYDNSSFRSVRVVKVIAQAVSASVSMLKWVAKLAFHITKHAIGVVSLIKSVAGLVPQAIDLFFVVYNRMNAKAEDRQLLEAAQREVDRLADRDMYDDERVRAEAKLAELNTAQLASKAAHREKLTVAAHKFFVGVMFIVGGVLALFPLTTVPGLAMLTAMSFYISIYKTADTLQSLPSADKQDEVTAGAPQLAAATSTTATPTISSTPPAAKRRIPIWLLMGASAGVAVTLAVITGGAATLICAIALFVISAGIIYVSKRKTEIALKAFKETETTRDENVEDAKPKLSQGAGMLQQLKQAGSPRTTLESTQNKTELETALSLLPPPEPVKPRKKFSTGSWTPNYLAEQYLNQPSSIKCS